jgi:hypothetical protein
MSIIRNAKQQINSFNNDIDVINTKHLTWQEAYLKCQDEVDNNRDQEFIQNIYKSILTELNINNKSVSIKHKTSFSNKPLAALKYMR